MLAERVLLTPTDPAWLPPGARAEIVLARTGAAAPEPTCLVRLLLTRADKLLTVPRPDGNGRDIPTSHVGSRSVGECLEELLLTTVGSSHQPALLGWVRNVVEQPDVGYPFPTPHAHFAVWHRQVGPETTADGEWLGPGEVEALLSGRHWWPLAAHVLRHPAR